MKNKVYTKNQNDKPLEKPRPSYILFGAFVLVCFIVFGIGGYYFGKQSSRIKPLEQNLPTPSPVATISNISDQNQTDDTTNWKTYSNEHWGVTFLYPGNWEIKKFNNVNEELPNYIELINNLENYIAFVYHDNPQNLTLEEIDEENSRIDKERGVGIDTPRLTSMNYTLVTLKNGNKAYYEKEYFCEPSICQRYIIVGEAKVIEVKIFPRLLQFENYPQIVEQILSSFKFH